MGRVISDRIRSLKLFLKSPEDANILIANKAIFKSIDLKIVRDSSLMERDYISNLRAELNNHVANGKQGITIKF